MYSRREIKERAKSMFRARYWPLVGLVLLVSALSGSSIGGGISGMANSSNISKQAGNIPLEVWIAIGTALTIAGIFGLAYVIFAGSVFSVGAAKIGTSAYRGENFGIGDVIHGFREGRYWRCVGTMALYALFVFLGSLLFIVPGIIVAIGLMPVPYMLADDRGNGAMDTIREAWDRMRGHKWEYFVFNLSFIGWQLLGTLTLGILFIFYVNPYIEVACAGYYCELFGARGEHEPDLPRLPEAL